MRDNNRSRTTHASRHPVEDTSRFEICIMAYTPLPRRSAPRSCCLTVTGISARSGRHRRIHQALRAGIAIQLAVLDDRGITTEPGFSSADALGTPGTSVAEKLTGHLLKEILVRGSRGGPLSPLASQLNDEVTHLQGQQIHGELQQLRGEILKALARLYATPAVPAEEQVTAGRAGGAPPGWPIACLDPFVLEVHRAVEVEPSANSGLPTLPVYVERKHDVLLSEAVNRAASGASVMVMLVSESSTGKTRASWEAVQRLPDDWRLWHPVGLSPPETLLKEPPQIVPRTVIWLNDAHNYLLSDADVGERVAAGLRDLLHDPSRRPVLIAGTIWTWAYGILVAEPQPGNRDLRAQARALMEEGIAIHVAETFDHDDLSALRVAATQDPRLAQAAKHADQGQVTQYLAGVPVLTRHYEMAPPAARALIEAAMDARRLGHRLSVPLKLLTDAVPGYLSRTQWDLLSKDWPQQALAWACESHHGIRGPLTEIRPLPSELAPDETRYRLSDYLDQQGRTQRRAIAVPASFWDACLAHAERGDLTSLGYSAERRGLFRIAFNLYTAAADAGDARGGHLAGSVLRETDRDREALSWYQRAAEAGDIYSVDDVVYLLNESEQLLAWLRKCAATGNTEAMEALAYREWCAGRQPEALIWYQRAGDGGDVDAIIVAGSLLHGAGRWQEALTWYQRAADAGSARALVRISEMFLEADRPREAHTSLQRAADTGELSAEAVMLMNAGHTQEALTWLTDNNWLEVNLDIDLDEADLPVPSNEPGTPSTDTERSKDALALQRAADGQISALSTRAGELARDGHWQKALTWFQRAVDAGDQPALGTAADMLAKVGQLEEAFVWYKRAVDTGNTYALKSAWWWADPEQIKYRGVEEELAWLRECAAMGMTEAFPAIARLLRKGRQSQEAIIWGQRALDAGEHDALRQLSWSLKDAGLIDEAARLVKYGLEPDHTVAQPWKARSPARRPSNP